MISTVYHINGPGRAGKGTFIKMVRLLMAQHDIPVYSFSSIFPIKKRMVDEQMWDGVSEKTDEVRRLMFEIKKQMHNAPNQYLIDSIKDVEGISFVHIREAQNITIFNDMLFQQLQKKSKSIHLERTTIYQFNSGIDHSSQTREFQDYAYDIVIDKDGLEYLFEKALSFVKSEFPKMSFKNINLNDLAEESLHVEYCDEERYGMI